MEKFVAYYRVSTQKQGQSGLGLESQKSIVQNFVKCQDCILAEFTEVESGKSDSRPELAKAIQAAKQSGARLVIAKLDRLSRNVRFISELMEAKVSFIACDMPDANQFTIHIFAALAQQEREMIAARTKAALQAKKARGEKLGNPRKFSADEREKGYATLAQKAASNPNNAQAAAFAKQLSERGLTPAEILTALQAGKFRTSRGLSFTQIVQVQRLLK